MADRSPHDTDPAVADTPTPDEVAAAGPEGDAPPEAGSRRNKGPRQVRSGDVLGRYELGDELGEGGMATVFRARDRELRRDVALKVLFPHLARRTEIVRRFHREARAAAGLEHPNILRIYDVGGAEGDDPPYIVMELIRGRTLLQEIEQRGAMLAEVVASVGALLADALAAAHAAGIIHRDIKPANVLIAPGGRLLLADFGVARLETEDSLVTKTGALLGTPAYMSPEQACGDMATARSDLYSLGASLYQLATGALPYAGPPAKVMSLIATGGMVEPVRRRPACGVELSRLIERLMAPDPNERPAHAMAIAAELRGFAASGGLGDATEELAAYFEDPDGFLGRRTPTVVAALVAEARTAMVQSRLPRAMGLANRASALAPADPEVASLIESVVDGGRASTRKRRLGLGGLGGVLVVGALGLGWKLARAPRASPPVAIAGSAAALDGADVAAIATDAAVAVSPSTGAAERLDAAIASLAPASGAAGRPDAGAPDTVTPSAVAGLAIEPADAAGSGGGRVRGGPPAPAPPPRSAELPRTGSVGVTSGTPTRVRDASMPRAGRGAPAASDGATAGSSTGETPPPAPSPQPAPAEVPSSPVAREAASAVGHLIVQNDVWCMIWIDGVDRGNRRNVPLEVTAGHHVVRCVNPAAGEWTQQTDVAPGTTRTLTGTLRREFTVTLAVDATINGTRHARGAVVKLRSGNFEVIVGGKKQFLVFRTSCTLRDTPDLGCYP